MLLEEELVRRLRVIDGLDLVRDVSSAVAATGGTVPISDLGVAARVSSTYLAKRFKAVVGVTPKRLARSYRFSSTVLALDVAAPIDWGDVAAGAGYFDQAHFVPSSGSSPGSRRPGTPKSGGDSCANIPATSWTAGRSQLIDFVQERQITPHKTWDSEQRRNPWEKWS